MLLVLACSHSNWAQAQDITQKPGRTNLADSGFCGSSEQEKTPIPNLKPGTSRISADATSSKAGKYSLKGNVIVEFNDKSLRADEATFDDKTRKVELKGKIKYEQKGLRVTANKGKTDLNQGSAEFNDIGYTLTEYAGRGKAKSIKIDNNKTVRLRNVTYTTCPANRPDWQLKAKNITLKTKEEVGYARNVSVRFKKIPIMYIPALSFPLSNKRKSGFLAPSMGNTVNSGLELTLPYYWNIAPNKDATITPRLMSKRGILLNSEYRHLGNNSNGIFGLEYLPNDRIYHDNRYLVKIDHQKNFSDHFKTELSINQVSDSKYFDDLGQNLATSSITHLEKRLDLLYDRDYWNFRARLHNYQSIGVADTWQRLPQLSLNADFPTHSGLFRYFINSEYTYFDHRQKNITTGSRLDIQPGIAMELGNSAYYIRPRISYRHTQYALNNTGVGLPEDPSRGLPIYSIDTQLFLDRPFRFGNIGNMTHTLSPRLHYLYVPYRDQSTLPVFDSSLLDFSYDQLFRENRFSGPDRQGDTRQVTVALSNRFTENKTGREVLSAHLGMIYYLDNRLVTLPGSSAETENRSDFVAELNLSPNKFTHLRSTVLWDTLHNQYDKAVGEIRYQRDRKHILNLGYRYQRNNIEQTDISSLWKLNNRWNGIARWTYSLRDKRNVERLLGLEYDACCWSAQIILRDYLDQSGNQTNKAIFFQLTMKGLTSVGSKIDDLLGESIIGYSDSSKVQ